MSKSNNVSITNKQIVQNNTDCSLEKQQEYIYKATSNNTRRAYRSAVKQYERHGGLLPASEQHIAEYITQRANNLNPRTIALHLTALSHWHTYQRLNDPTQSHRIKKLIKGIYRTHGKPKRKAKALQPQQIKKLIHQCRQNGGLKALRDSALIQLAYFGAFRRSELLSIKFEDISFNSKGLIIMVPQSKTDQFGKGISKAIPYGKCSQFCPVTALKEWLIAANISTGFIFRSVNRWDQLQENNLHKDSLNIIIKSLAQQCGMMFIEEISSHSFRRGFATSAAQSGAEFSDIKRQGGWTSDDTVRGYIEEGNMFDNNAAAHLMEHEF